MSRKHKSLSPVVSSTVNGKEDGEDCDIQRISPKPQEEVPHQSPPVHVSNTIKNTNENCLPANEEGDEQDLFAKPQSEVVFRRPPIALRPSKKQNKLDVVSALHCFHFT